MKIQMKEGMRFNRLICSRPDVLRGTKNSSEFICDCGSIVIRKNDNVKSGMTKSCGCLRKYAHNKRRETHGASNSKTWKTWSSMKNRCLNSNYDRYSSYGGRGITVCDRWFSFEKFFEDMGTRPDGKTLDRIDNNGNYEPSNCRWSTPKQQLRNTRTTVFLNINGKRTPLVEACEIFAVAPYLVRERIKRGWSAIESLITPARQIKKPTRIKI